MTCTLLPESFYNQDTLTIARQLLGKILCVRSNKDILTGRIVETEAYLFDDPACHAFRGKTPRNSTLFGPPGHAHVYFTYGSHFMLNVSTNVEGVGEGVLIRALEPVEGIEIMRLNRNRKSEPDHKLGAGPGKLAKALGITREAHDGLNLYASCDSSLTILDAPEIPDSQVGVSPRIGITHAVDELWRFTVNSSRSLSRK